MIVVCVIIVLGIIFFLSTQTYQTQVVIEEKVYNVDVVDTQYLLSKGLSGRSGLAPNEGMLFVFANSDEHSFWMKDMLFPIDIIWIDENWKVVDIEPNVSPNTYPKIFVPNAPAKYVLEISAGESVKNGITIGEQVNILEKEF